MEKELQQKLFDKYPKLFVQKDMDCKETCMCWGIDCGDGWYGIIDDVCDTIMGWDRSNYPEKPQFVQVKEKFGTLRIYHDGDDWVDGVIAMAETVSERTCECCGKPGKLNKGPWFIVRCPYCYMEGK